MVERLLAVFLVLFFAQGELFSCGVESQLPYNHFNGVNERGYVSYWEQIAAVDFGNGLRLPVIINFRSDRNSSSSYLGSGWSLPLVESFIYPVNERNFVMVGVDGANRYFYRKNSQDTILKDKAGWAAEIKDDTITAWAECGWKYTFKNGKVMSIQTPGGRTLDYLYSGDRVTGIREGGNEVVKMIVNPTDKKATGMEFNNRRIQFELRDRSIIRNAAGNNPVTETALTLNKVTEWKVEPREYIFGVNEKNQLTLQIGDRLITWNPETKRIISDGGWTYEISINTDKEVFANAAIKRTNSKGESEFWHKDNAKGTEEVQGIDGVSEVTMRFTSGNLMGKVRKIQRITKEGEKKDIFRATYDEQGKVLREVLEDGSRNEYEYAANGDKIQKRMKDGNFQFKRIFSADGKTLTVEDASGKTEQVFFDDKDRDTKTLINGKLHSLKTYAPEGTWQKTEVYSNDGAKLTRTFYSEYDENGRLISEKATDHLGGYPETIRRFKYDNFGKLTEITDSANGITNFMYSADGEKIVKFISKEEAKDSLSSSSTEK